MLKITATFLDEISGDIAHQNWGPEEWDADFRAMRSVGIDTVVLIRCGLGRFMTYDSEVLRSRMNCFTPPEDLTQMFLDLAQKYGMKFFFGNYSGGFHVRGDFEKEIDLNKAVCEEAWKRYGSHPAFAGWYLTQEVGRLQWNIIEVMRELGRFCKAISGNLPVMISPYIEGIMLYDPFGTGVNAGKSVTLPEFSREWDEIMAGIAGAVDIVAFQDGGCAYWELEDFLRTARELADKHGIVCQTNVETFDRDMPIRFLPIKWEKMHLKLQIAERAGIHEAITFEFSHFLSPNSCYPQAHGLFRHYQKYLREGDFIGSVPSAHEALK